MKKISVASFIAAFLLASLLYVKADTVTDWVSSSVYTNATAKITATTSGGARLTIDSITTTGTSTNGAIKATGTATVNSLVVTTNATIAGNAIILSGPLPTSTNGLAAGTLWVSNNFVCIKL